ncbi:unknown [Clostridium sp. CAG:1219]|nr:unknown [Clostridium sp. CAG:1219]
MILVHVEVAKSIKIVVKEINNSLNALIPRAFLISKMQLIFKYIIEYVIKKLSKMYLEN